MEGYVLIDREGTETKFGAELSDLRSEEVNAWPSSSEPAHQAFRQSGQTEAKTNIADASQTDFYHPGTKQGYSREQDSSPSAEREQEFVLRMSIIANVETRQLDSLSQSPLATSDMIGSYLRQTIHQLDRSIERKSMVRESRHSAVHSVLSWYPHTAPSL
jgi:hypothetical protein